MADGDLSSTMPLRDYLIGLGYVMRLPARPLERRKARDGESASRSIAGPLLAIAAALAVTLGAIRFWPRDTAVPAEILGAWQSADARYQNRSMEIEAAVVRFQVDDAPPRFEQYPILRTQVTRRDSVQVVTVVYGTAGRESQLRLLLEGARLSLANQPAVIWRRR